jgi:hypothetical protein
VNPSTVLTGQGVASGSTSLDRVAPARRSVSPVTDWT